MVLPQKYIDLYVKCPLYRMSLLSCHGARQLGRTESLHPPGQLVTDRCAAKEQTPAFCQSICSQNLWQQFRKHLEHETLRKNVCQV